MPAIIRCPRQYLLTVRLSSTHLAAEIPDLSKDLKSHEASFPTAVEIFRAGIRAEFQISARNT